MPKSKRRSIPFPRPKPVPDAMAEPYRKAFGPLYIAARKAQLSADDHILVQQSAETIEQALVRLSALEKAKTEPPAP